MLKTKTFRRMLLCASAILCLTAGTVFAAQQSQEWELIIPAGEIQKSTIDPAPRITSLDGKTVALRWNGKHNGDVFLTRIAELFAEKLPKTKVIKTFETAKAVNIISGSQAQSEMVTNTLKDVKPDLVISAQAD